MNRRGWIIQTFNGAKSGAAFGAVFGALTGGITSKSCFVAGTEILTVAGLVAIENISEGDEVLAENPETGEKGVKRVVQTFVKETYNLVHIYVEDEEIVTTPEHPFWEMNREWCSAIEIRAGDILKLANGKTAIVSKVYSEALSSPVTVYNFEVEDYHTYYVGEDSVLVHNWCSTKNTKTKWDIKKYSKDSIKTSYKGTPVNAQFDGKYYWIKDFKGDGGSAFKVFKLEGKNLKWVHDADEYGNFITGKHKGPVGLILKI